MKKPIGILSIFAATFTSPAYAAAGTVGANVSAVYVPISSTANSQLHVNNYDSSAGTCLKPPAPVQIYMLPAGGQGDKMRQALLAAQLAGKKVAIAWDDTKKDASGYCIVQSIAVLT
jgi:hypothetical protein